MTLNDKMPNLPADEVDQKVARFEQKIDIEMRP